MELADLLGVGGPLEGLDRQAGAAAGISADERFGDLGEGRQLTFRPRTHVRPGRPPTPVRARARSGAVDPRDSRARSRPG